MLYETAESRRNDNCGDNKRHIHGNFFCSKDIHWINNTITIRSRVCLPIADSQVMLRWH